MDGAGQALPQEIVAGTAGQQPDRLPHPWVALERAFSSGALVGAEIRVAIRVFPDAPARSRAARLGS